VDVGVEMEVDGIGMPRGHGIYSVSTHAYVRDRTLLPHGAVATSSYLSSALCWEPALWPQSRLVESRSWDLIGLRLAALLGYCVQMC